ncbi:properdin-like [Genypterus blacodes]|uniref:properdin-like n=1 Tax=Genypterus blacodes TaxID=154954 RepID=UPI003F7758DA
MKMKTRLLLVLLVLLVSLEGSECVQCFARFDLTSGLCEEELGEVDNEDDCCQNINYAYKTVNGECHACGRPAWTPWSPWSPCTVLCGEGVRQRGRKCFGLGECDQPEDTQQTQPCSATCCDGGGWDSWLSWSPCSVSCGGVGVKKRERVCSTPPECRAACSGSSQETNSCSTQTACPVHGGWSGWSDWTRCSASCIVSEGGDVIVPSRERNRSCSSPAPSDGTVPPGTRCPGDSTQDQDCSELPNCPVDGSWGAWSPPRPCSVSCGEGLRLSIRRCDSPSPKYGGGFCEGPSTRSSVCQGPCPVDGLWTGWSSWSQCSTSCIQEGRPSVRTRQRSCSNPAPSSSPQGKACPGVNRQTENCNHLPHCPVDGGWGPWGPFSSCSVTCGLGLQESIRRCESPAPKHKGHPCPGAGHRSIICKTNVHCPVDGEWAEWAPWERCTGAYGKRDIRCKDLSGRQTRLRSCLNRAFNGSICEGSLLTETQVCFDITNCPLKGSWAGWSDWSLCDPSCGGNSKRSRKRICAPDLSSYRTTIGPLRQKASFYGEPRPNCGFLPEDEKEEILPCLNVPACP